MAVRHVRVRKGEEGGTGEGDAEGQCRTKKESCVALVSGRWFPFLLLSRTPSSSLLSLPCADAQGWNSTLLDNARKFRLKFTVADPQNIVFHRVFVTFGAARQSDQPSPMETPKTKKQGVRRGGIRSATYHGVCGRRLRTSLCSCIRFRRRCDGSSCPCR